MRLRGGLKAVDRLHRDVGSRLKAEGVIRAGKVVVNGLGDADDVYAPLAELVRNAQSIVAAYRHNALEIQRAEHLDYGLGPVGIRHDVRAGAADYGAAHGLDALHLGGGEPAALRAHGAAPAVAEAEYLNARFGALFNNAPYDRVKTGAVAAAGQDADLSHIFDLIYIGIVNLFIHG